MTKRTRVRDAVTGQFSTQEEADRRPDETVVEKVNRPGEPLCGIQILIERPMGVCGNTMPCAEHAEAHRGSRTAVVERVEGRDGLDCENCGHGLICHTGDACVGGLSIICGCTVIAEQRDVERMLLALATKDPTVEIRIHSEGWMKELQVSEPGIDTLQSFRATEADGGIHYCIKVAHELMCDGGRDGE